MSVGRIFAVVGPSGVGKDTLMGAVARALPEVHIARRVITRPATPDAEDFESVTEAEFAHRADRGAFLLSWSAHGLSYGIPASEFALAARGGTVIFNGSRAMLGDAARSLPGLRVIHVTADEAVLRQRLKARGRESDAVIAERLRRARLPLPAGLNVTEIDNSGPMAHAVAELCAVLAPDIARKDRDAHA